MVNETVRRGLNSRFCDAFGLALKLYASTTAHAKHNQLCVLSRRTLKNVV